MGGLAGHMNHIHEDLDLSLRDLLNILQGLTAGCIKTKEKVDGQNIFFTVDKNIAKLARNKSDVRKVGRDFKTLKSDFLDARNPMAAMAYGDGCEAIQRAIDTLPDDIKQICFEPGLYVNCEIIHAKKPNIIVYNKNYIVLHNFVDFSNSLTDSSELNARLALFLRHVEGLKVTIETGDVWEITGPKFLEKFEPVQEDMKEIQDITSCLTAQFKWYGLSLNNTLSDFAERRLANEILADMGVSDNRSKSMLIDYLLRGGNSVLVREDLKASVDSKILRMLTLSKMKTKQKRVVRSATQPINDQIQRLASIMLNNLDSVFADNPKLASSVLRGALGMQNEIRKNLDDVTNFDKNLSFLGNIESLNISIEGIVFEYQSKTYKLTGPFAYANQVLGMAGFDVKDSIIEKSLIQNLRKVEEVSV